MSNAIILLVIGSILCASFYKIFRDKKKGVKCVGCASSPKGKLPTAIKTAHKA